MERLFGYSRKFLASFTAVFTCVILASAVFIGLYSSPTLPCRLIAQALLLSAVSALLSFIYMSEKPIRKRAMAIRTCAHFFTLLATALLCAWRFAWFRLSHTPSLLAFLLLFVTVYAVIRLAGFLSDLLNERNIHSRNFITGGLIL